MMLLVQDIQILEKDFKEFLKARNLEMLSLHMTFESSKGFWDNHPTKIGMPSIPTMTFKITCE